MSNVLNDYFCRKFKEMKESLEAFKELLEIMDTLRDNCPWDMKQTFESIRHLTIEETYELSEAILDKDLDGIKKELGDLMLHIVFYSKIGSEKNAFDITDVLKDINAKLIKRHPHIYDDIVVADAREVKDRARNWERIKIMHEGNRSVLAGVPNSLPSLVKAYRIQEKVRGVGFDWEKPEQVWEKVVEELNEFKSESEKSDNKEKMEEEFGDLIFALINYGRFLDLNPEDALEKTNKKFIKRFKHLEESAKKLNKSLHEMSLSEMDVFWEEAKKFE